MKQNQTFFYETYSNLTSFFISRKILKYFNDFQNWHILILLQKWAQTNKVKQNYTGHCANLTVIFLIYQVVYHQIDFWNLFVDKIYLKKEW